MIIEYVPYGDLLGYLRRSRGVNDCYYDDPEINPTTNVTSEQMLKFAWQISDGMRYISSKKVRFCYYQRICSCYLAHKYNFRRYSPKCRFCTETSQQGMYWWAKTIDVRLQTLEWLATSTWKKFIFGEVRYSVVCSNLINT